MHHVSLRRKKYNKKGNGDVMMRLFLGSSCREEEPHMRPLSAPPPPPSPGFIQPSIHSHLKSAYTHTHANPPAEDIINLKDHKRKKKKFKRRDET